MWVQVPLSPPPFASVTLRVAGHPSGTANAKECHTKPTVFLEKISQFYKSAKCDGQIMFYCYRAQKSVGLKFFSEVSAERSADGCLGVAFTINARYSFLSNTMFSKLSTCEDGPFLTNTYCTTGPAVKEPEPALVKKVSVTVSYMPKTPSLLRLAGIILRTNSLLSYNFAL